MNTEGRRRALGPGDGFCGWQRAVQRYGAEGKVRAVAGRLGAREAIMYGELCGGLYRHPGVRKVEGAVGVQGESCIQNPSCRQKKTALKPL